MLQSQLNIQMQQIFNLIYPVGSLYFSTVLDTVAKVQAAFGGTWEKLPDGYAIWTASSGAGNTITPGIPNITGSIDKLAGNIYCAGDSSYQGAFVYSSQGSHKVVSGSSGNYDTSKINFDASRSNSIYGNSDTVQPPAYKTYVFKRLTLGGA